MGGDNCCNVGQQNENCEQQEAENTGIINNEELRKAASKRQLCYYYGKGRSNNSSSGRQRHWWLLLTLAKADKSCIDGKGTTIHSCETCKGALRSCDLPSWVSTDFRCSGLSSCGHYCSNSEQRKHLPTPLSCHSESTGTVVSAKRPEL